MSYFVWAWHDSMAWQCNVMQQANSNHIPFTLQSCIMHTPRKYHADSILTKYFVFWEGAGKIHAHKVIMNWIWKIKDRTHIVCLNHVQNVIRHALVYTWYVQVTHGLITQPRVHKLSINGIWKINWTIYAACLKPAWNVRWENVWQYMYGMDIETPKIQQQQKIR